MIIRDGDTSIVGNRELFHFSSSRFRISADDRVARLENGRPRPRTKTLLSYVEATGRFHLRLVVRHAAWPGWSRRVARPVRRSPKGGGGTRAPKIISCWRGRRGSLRRRFRVPTFLPHKSA